VQSGIKEYLASPLFNMSVTKRNENFAACCVATVLMILAGSVIRLPAMTENHVHRGIQTGIECIS
jgi:hypothetical protein